MFEFQQVLSDTYDWPVELKIPVDGGKPKVIKFTAVFNRLTKTEATRMLDSAREENEDGITVIRYQTVFDAVLADLKAKKNDGKVEVLPDDVREELLEISGAEAAIFSSYTASLVGERAKNG